MIVAVIPAYNEELTIGKIVKKARKYVDEVIVVDDGSTDNTAIEAKKSGAVVVRHEKNYGVGRATRTGFSKALQTKAKYIITLDADGQHDPDDIPKFIEKLKEGYDFVLGRRNLSNYPLVKRVGNLALNFIINFISGTTIPDTESGFRGYRRNALEKLVLKADGYEICDEIIFEVGRNNLKWAVVPIKSHVYRKGTGVLDGLRILRFMLRRRKRNWRSYIDDFKYVISRWRRIF